MAAGYLADVLTTWMSVRTFGPRYEQNPVSIGLVGNIGFLATAAIGCVLCLVIFEAGRTMAIKQHPTMLLSINLVLAPLVLFRAVVVTLAVLGLLGAI